MVHPDTAFLEDIAGKLKEVCDLCSEDLSLSLSVSYIYIYMDLMEVILNCIGMLMCY